MANENKQKNLWAFLVGINDYAVEAHNLKGCENDVKAIEAYLKAYAEGREGLSLHIRKLLSKDATRDNIINGFQHFSEAKDGDICLFYFSGHGSQTPAPDVFWSEADKLNESIVCYDSRIEGGYDLVDKELAFLIHEATHKKDLHFVAIMDSCHSGSNTRQAGLKVRMAEQNTSAFPLEKYYGYESYKDEKVMRDGRETLNVPRGKHIQLAAALSTELAKEKILGDENRGVFTYSLIEVLQENGGNLSYANLMNKVRSRVASRVKKQTPILDGEGLKGQEKNNAFLAGELGREKLEFLVDKSLDESWLKAGAVHGITMEAEITVFKNEDDKNGKRVEILEVQPTRTKLKGLAFGFEPGKTYTAEVAPQPAYTMKVAFDTANSPEDTATLKEVMEGKRSPYLELAPPETAQFIMRAMDGGFRLTYPEDTVPIFRRVEGTGKNEANMFAMQMETMAKWYNTRALENGASRIKESEVKIELSRITEPGNHEDDAPAEVVENWETDTIFRYAYDKNGPENPWKVPAMRLKVTNTSETKDFWVSALWIGTGYNYDEESTRLFNVTNEFLPSAEIKRGENRNGETQPLFWVEEDDDNDRLVHHQTLGLFLPDDYAGLGYTETRDLIKIIVSTERFESDSYNLEGLELDMQELGITKVVLKTKKNEKPDWRTFDVPIVTVRPRDEGLLKPGQDLEGSYFAIQGHSGFGAHLLLSTMDELLRCANGDEPPRRANLAHPNILWGDEKLNLVEFTVPMGSAGGISVIEFYEPAGAEKVTADQPLVMHIYQSAPEGKTAVPFGYQAESHSYIPLGHTNEAGYIVFEKLPAPSPSKIQGLGDSIKVFLQWVDKEADLKEASPHPPPKEGEPA